MNEYKYDMMIKLINEYIANKMIKPHHDPPNNTFVCVVDKMYEMDEMDDTEPEPVTAAPTTKELGKSNGSSTTLNPNFESNVCTDSLITLREYFRIYNPISNSWTFWESNEAPENFVFEFLGKSEENNVPARWVHKKKVTGKGNKEIKRDINYKLKLYDYFKDFKYDNDKHKIVIWAERIVRKADDELNKFTVYYVDILKNTTKIWTGWTIIRKKIIDLSTESYSDDLVIFLTDKMKKINTLFDIYITGKYLDSYKRKWNLLEQKELFVSQDVRPDVRPDELSKDEKCIFLNLPIYHAALGGSSYSCSPHRRLREFPTYELNLEELDNAPWHPTDNDKAE